MKLWPFSKTTLNILCINFLNAKTYQTLFRTNKHTCFDRFIDFKLADHREMVSLLAGFSLKLLSLRQNLFVVYTNFAFTKKTTLMRILL